MSGANAVPGSGTPWPSFKYVPVRGLMDRHISRWLRTQRKNMRGFFASQGLTVFVDRMDRIRKSNKSMLEKNQMFQGVLNEYSKLVSPGAPPAAAAEAGDPQVPGGAAVAVQPADPVAADASGAREDDGAGVQELASDDGVGLVVEE
jgi:hypothetical protein